MITTAGDAIICVFRCHESTFHVDLESSTDDTMSTLEDCMNAINCALEVRWCITTELSSHIAITSGMMSFSVLGGLDDSWVYILNGDPLDKISSCLNESRKQEIVVDEKFYSKITATSEFSPELFEATTDGNYRLVGRDSRVIVDYRLHLDFKRDVIFPKSELQLVIQRFVPKPVSYAIEGCYLNRIAELRNVTTVFINVDTYSILTHSNPCTLQPFFEMIQKNCSSTGAYMRQFLIDDKGCVAILMWGVPSFSYQDNCSRALKAVSSIQILSKSMGIRCSVGITLGSCCCGLIGSSRRQDYVILGASVNLAARLMSKADGRILVSSSVFAHVPTYLQKFLERIEDLTLKGHSSPVETYELPRSKLYSFHIYVLLI